MLGIAQNSRVDTGFQYYVIEIVLAILSMLLSMHPCYNPIDSWLGLLPLECVVTVVTFKKAVVTLKSHS